MKSGYSSKKVENRASNFLLVKVVKATSHMRNGAITVRIPDTSGMCVIFAPLPLNIHLLFQDCDELPRPWGTLDNPSAFGAYNMMSGPFYDPSTEPARIRRGPRDPHADWSLLPDNLNLNIPVDVGKRGRNKDREKLEKRLRDQEDNDVDGDWFTSRNTKNPGINELPPPRGRSVKFGSSLKDRIVKATPLSLGSVKPPSLLDRIGGSFDTDQHRHRDRGKPTDSLSLRIRGAADDRKHHDSRYSPKYDRHRERYRRDRDKDRDRSRDRGSDRNHGPQYKGGYSR